MKQLLSITLGLALATGSLAGCAAQPTQAEPVAQLAKSAAPEPAGQDLPLIVVGHIDIVRSTLDRALPLLRGYVAAARQEPGIRHIELLVQVGVPNHFTLVETWASRAAYEAHVGAPGVREFRRQIDPFLASPYDDRLHNEVGAMPQ